MKIQSGDNKGHKIYIPNVPTIRPSTGKVREALIDILKSRSLVLNARVLDIYAGTGAVGFELLSNGARDVVFIEKSAVGAETIRKNASKLKKENFIRLIRSSALSALDQLITEGKKFDIIYADPPYNVSDDEISAVAEAVKNLIAENGVFILEHSSKRAFNFSCYEVLTSKRYGDTMLTFFKKVG